MQTDKKRQRAKMWQILIKRQADGRQKVAGKKNLTKRGRQSKQEAAKKKLKAKKRQPKRSRQTKVTASYIKLTDKK